MEGRTTTAAGERQVVTSQIKRILVPTDLTAIAHVAFEFALDLAERSGAGIDLMMVLGPIDGDAFSPVQYSPEAVVRGEKAEQLIRKELTDLVDLHATRDIDVSVTTRKGRPIPTIVSRAEQVDADLIVVGAHDRGRLHHFLIKSVAEDIVRHAPCSVLLVHENDEAPPGPLKRLLVPIDLSDVSFRLLSYARYLAELNGARIDVLHVVEPIPLLDTLAGAMTIRDVVPDMKRRLEAEVAELLRQIDFGDVEHEARVVEGQAAAQILSEAEQQQNDMVVIGKQGRSAIERFLVGSVTERVVRHASCPVLVARL